MRDAEPLVEHGRVDGAEVDGMTGVAVVEVGKIGVRPVQTRFHRPAQEENGGRGAVVSAAAAVFAQPAAEFGEDQDQHPLRLARFLQVIEERPERCTQLAQQERVPLELAAVSVKAVQVSVVKIGGREPCLDQLRHQAEPLRQTVELGIT